MKPAAAIYTAASVAVLGLMIYTRTPVAPATPAQAAPAQQQEAATTDDAAPEQQETQTGTSATQQEQAPTLQTAADAPDTQQQPAEQSTPETTVTQAETTATQQTPPTATAAPPATGVTQEEATAATPATGITQEEATEPAAEEKKNDAEPASNATPDYGREQRMASEISDMILDGDVIELNDGNEDFMAILTEAEQPRGAVIILHGRGFHPDWQDVANPLRVGLAEKGWTTLSLQMPVLEKEAKYYDYVPLFPNADKRIDAGINLLKERGISPIVLVGHSCGAHMAMHWVESRGDSDIAAYIGLGMGATDYQQEMKGPFPLAQMKVPVLDIYGEKEYPQVINMAPERLSQMQQAGNAQSKQMVLPGANHYFTDKGSELTAVVANWLNSLPL